MFEADFLVIPLPGNAKLVDRGDHLSIVKDGEPTAEETRIMVAAGKARGWTSVRFSGGSPEWQRKARLEAIRQGYPEGMISIECEDGRMPVAMMPMPDHLRRRLGIPAPENETAPEGPMGPAHIPAPEPRP